MPRKKVIRRSVKNLIIADKQVDFLINNLPASTQIIQSKKSLDERILQSKYSLSNVVILVELEWNNQVGQFLGYQIAKELLSNPNRQTAFNLVFISTFPRETLINLEHGNHHAFTFHYPHFRIKSDFSLDSILKNIGTISERKFNYLRYTCALESGIISQIIHDFDLSSEEGIEKYIKQLELNQAILTKQINELTHLCRRTTERDTIAKYLLKINTALKDLRNKIESSNKSEIKQSEDKVLVIEDDKEVLEEIVEKLRPYYKNINDFQSGTAAMKELRRNANAYSLVVTDMKIVDGLFADPVQGIDIVEACENDYPFLVVRITTGLPRYAVQQLSGKKSYEILYKDKNRQAVRWFDHMDNFIEKINQEIKRKDKLRIIPGPQSRAIWKPLSLRLQKERAEETKDYYDRWQFVKEKANLFLAGHFDSLPEEKKLPVNFYKGKRPYENIEPIWRNNVNDMLIHRLIALAFAKMNSWRSFIFSGNDPNAYVNQAGFKTGLNSKSTKAYFNTILGLSGKGFPSNNEDVRYQIIAKQSRLFPEEEDWLQKIDIQKTILINAAPNMDRLILKLELLTPDIGTLYKTKATHQEIRSIFENLNQVLTKLSNKRTIDDLIIELEDYIEEEQHEFNSLPQYIQDSLAAMLKKISI